MSVWLKEFWTPDAQFWIKSNVASFQWTGTDYSPLLMQNLCSEPFKRKPLIETSRSAEEFLLRNLIPVENRNETARALSFNVRVLNYNLTNIALPMKETTEHWNPVTQKDPSPPLYCNADDTTTFWSVCFQVWHSVHTSGRSKKTKEWANVHFVTNTAGTDCSF